MLIENKDEFFKFQKLVEHAIANCVPSYIDDTPPRWKEIYERGLRMQEVDSQDEKAINAARSSQNKFQDFVQKHLIENEEKRIEAFKTALEKEKAFDKPNKYIWNEDKICDEILQYCNKTYSQHYAGDDAKTQFTEYFTQHHTFDEIMASFKFNAGKYVMRFGKKKGYNREDVLKCIHYCIMMLHMQQKDFEDNGF